MVKNPGHVRDHGGRGADDGGIFTADAGLRGFVAQLAIWLWFTVLFANFAEAVAEGRGKAQAASLRRARKETMARRLHERPRRKSSGADLAKGRSRRLRSGRHHSGGRRRHRRNRQRRRSRHHRRIRAGHPRERRRPQRGHGRHTRAQRSHRHSRHDGQRAAAFSIA